MGGSKGKWMGTRSDFLWRPGFPVMSRRIAKRVTSLIWVVLGEKLAVVGKIVCRKAKGPFTESECFMVQRDFQRGVSDSRATAGQEWRRDSQRLLCRRFCDTLLIIFSVYHRGRGSILGRRMRGRVG